jgi:FkbM family methyltransferase
MDMKKRRVQRWRRAIWLGTSRLWYGRMRRIEAHGKSLWVLTNDLRAHMIAKAKGTQKEKVAVWLAMASARPEICLDVGANYGEFTVATIDLQLPTVCVEANANLLPCLEKTFAGAKHVTLVNAAVSGVESEVSFYVDPRYSGTGSLAREVPTPSRRDLTGKDGQIEEVTVPARTLDTIVSRHLGRWPDSWIAKVDVEGYEIDVLEGSQLLRGNARSWRMMLEYNPVCIRRMGQSADLIWEQYVRFPGRIVKGHPPDLSSLRADEELPERPPDFDCEVIIGRGFTADSIRKRPGDPGRDHG